MSKIAMHLHGMGVGLAAEQEANVKKLAEKSGYEIISLHYGNIFEAAGLFEFAGPAADKDSGGLESLSKEAAYRLGRDEAFFEGYAAAMLGFAEEGPSVQAQGEAGQGAARASRDLWYYVAKYLARDKLHSDVIKQVRRLILTETNARKLEDKSVVLIGHSLGSIVALDVLDTPALRPYFVRLVTVGSPAGMIAGTPRLGRSWLPPQKRAVDVEWIDVYDERDLVAKFTLSHERGFKGDPLNFRNTHQPHGFPESHTAYFTDDDVVDGWASLLDGWPTPPPSAQGAGR